MKGCREIDSRPSRSASSASTSYAVEIFPCNFFAIVGFPRLAMRSAIPQAMTDLAEGILVKAGVGLSHHCYYPPSIIPFTQPEIKFRIVEEYVKSRRTFVARKPSSDIFTLWFICQKPNTLFRPSFLFVLTKAESKSDRWQGCRHYVHPPTYRIINEAQKGIQREIIHIIADRVCRAGFMRGSKRGLRPQQPSANEKLRLLCIPIWYVII